MTVNRKEEEGHLVLQTDQEVLKKSEIKAMFELLEGQNTYKTSTVIDFSLVKEIKVKAGNELKKLATLCVSKQIPTVFYMRPELEQDFMDKGLHYLIPCFTDFKKALENLPQKVGEVTSGMEKFHSSVISCTQYAIKTMCSTEITAKDHYIRGEQEPPDLDIASIAGVTAENVKGIVIIGFKKDTLTSFMQRMLEDDELSFGVEVKSGATEFLNVLIGQLKGELSDWHISSGIPALIVGGSLDSVPMQLVFKSNSTIIPFESDAGEFFVEYMMFNVENA